MLEIAPYFEQCTCVELPLALALAAAVAALTTTQVVAPSLVLVAAALAAPHDQIIVVLGLLGVVVLVAALLDGWMKTYSRTTEQSAISPPTFINAAAQPIEHGATRPHFGRIGGPGRGMSGLPGGSGFHHLRAPSKEGLEILHRLAQPISSRAIMDFFEKFTESISSDLQFIIDDISTEDSSAIGVSWHLEWRGRPFPYSKGCSFYRLEVLDGKRQIVYTIIEFECSHLSTNGKYMHSYGRDCVEPAIKPGDMAL
ncbi:hypothetical protein Taro_024360, partial [Colocasia esculenta]|nr:hypothetical protein [Colocasia esculenta]